MSGSPTLVPTFVRAEDPEGLRRECLKVNLALGGQVLFHSIQYVQADSLWYAWYSQEIKTLHEVIKLAGSINNGGKVQVTPNGGEA